MLNPLAAAKRTTKKIKTKLYTAYFYLTALSEYWISPQGWRGGHTSRLKEIGKHAFRKNNKIAIFVGFASTLTASNKAYLETLTKAGFDIVYISNRQIDQHSRIEICSLCWKVFERSNIGRDFGAFRDGIIWADEQGYLRDCTILLIANDSMQFIPGRNAESLVTALKEFELSDDQALFSHISYYHDIHYQSYFQVLKSDVFRSSDFIAFWHNYVPLSHRGHCIHKGELGLSQKVYTRLRRVRILYSSTHLIEHLKSQYLNDSSLISARELLRSMPSPARTLQQKIQNHIIRGLMHKADKGDLLNDYDLNFLADLIENNNPSHIAAFLFPFFLECPLVKQDLCSAGSFSIAQAALLFREALEKSLNGLASHNIDTDLHVDEFVRVLNAKGTPISHMGKPREAAQKGISGGFVYSNVYDDLS